MIVILIMKTTVTVMMKVTVILVMKGTLRLKLITRLIETVKVIKEVTKAIMFVVIWVMSKFVMDLQIVYIFPVIVFVLL